jgi:hypothetical protein
MNAIGRSLQSSCRLLEFAFSTISRVGAASSSSEHPACNGTALVRLRSNQFKVNLQFATGRFGTEVVQYRLLGLL